MNRDRISVKLDRSLWYLVCLIARMSGEYPNEVVDNAVVFYLLDRIEDSEAPGLGAVLETVAGNIHQHWEDQGRRDQDQQPLPF